MNKFYLELMTVIKRFKSDAKGQIAIMFAVLVLPMSVMIGASIDWSQQISATAKMQSTMDSAILAVARALSVDPDLSKAKQRAIAQIIFDTNISVAGNVKLNNFTLDKTDELITMSQSGSIDNTFLKLIDIPSMELTVSSEVNIKFGGVDLALAVDLSGSMRGNKIAHLRNATKSLLKELAAASVSEMRVAFIPWTRGVNVGGYYDKLAVKPVRPPCYWYWRHGRQYRNCPPKPTPNDCIDIRPGGLFVPNNTTINHPDTTACPVAKLIPLTDLSKKINGKTGEKRLKDIAVHWNATGGTGSHNGIYWAWATLSETFWPVFGTTTPTDPDAIKKYAIIMTDGLNNHSSFNTTMITTCTAMKKAGISIYTIVLMETNRSVINTFKSCASPNSSGRKFAIVTSNANELDSVFQQIAGEIGQFYLSK